MLEEIAKITQYPDRRIKAIVSTVCSSRIRVGGTICDGETYNQFKEKAR